MRNQGVGFTTELCHGKTCLKGNRFQYFRLEILPTLKITHNFSCDLSLINNQNWRLCIKLISNDKLNGIPCIQSIGSNSPFKNFVMVILKESGLLLVWHRLQNIICEGNRVQFYSRCHSQRMIGGGPPANLSFAMPSTKTLRHVFPWHSSIIQPLRSFKLFKVKVNLFQCLF